MLEVAINKLGLGARAYTRTRKVARTIADLEGSENIHPSHISEAISTAAWIGDCKYYLTKETPGDFFLKCFVDTWLAPYPH